MNKSKWRAAPLHRLVIKLSEETGEVARACNDAYDANGRDKHNAALESAMEECDHVIFIAGEIKEQSLALLTTRLANGCQA
jgi:NTP pyrophosphatase (non-canonical NTP hydrolase)